MESGLPSRWRGVRATWLGLMLLLLTIPMLVACSVSTASAQTVATRGAPQQIIDNANIFPANAKLEVIFDKGCFLEGVAPGHDGMLYFSDITSTYTCADSIGVQAGHIWRLNPNNLKAEIFRSPSGMSNGIKFDAHGNMVVAEGADFGGRRITRTDMSTGKSYLIAGLYNGNPLNSPNDITIDEQGRIYFTDPRYYGYETINQPIFGVYRIDTDGSLHLIITDGGKPNGLAVSPDQHTLYLVSNDDGSTGPQRLPSGAPVLRGLMALLAYDLHPDGTVSNRRVLVNYAPEAGPDGMRVDTRGDLWVAVTRESKPGVAVYTPTGQEIAYVHVDNPVTNVAFGRGNDRKTLYITAGAKLYRIQTNRQGYQLPSP